MLEEVMNATEAEQTRRLIMANAHALTSCVEESWSDTARCTRQLTEAVMTIAEGGGATVEREVVIGTLQTRPGSKRGLREGRVDVLARFGDGSVLCVEIDTHYKTFSKDKLLLAKRLGWAELWIRWDGPWTTVKGLMVVNVESRGRKRPSVRGHPPHPEGRQTDAKD